MAQSLSQVYVHITFSTKHRRPLIDESIAPDFWGYMGGLCKARECVPVRIGGHDDHAHICCLLSKKITQIKLLEEVKKESSHWVKTRGGHYGDFYWQDGYGIFSVNPSEIETVAAYIDGQREHHKKRTFQEEFLAFLKKYGVKYDERYLWD